MHYLFFFLERSVVKSSDNTENVYFFNSNLFPQKKKSFNTYFNVSLPKGSASEIILSYLINKNILTRVYCKERWLNYTDIILPNR